MNSTGNNSGDLVQDAELGLQFPCRYEVKAMGLQNPRFEALVQSIVSNHIGRDEMLATTSRASKNGKYISITCIIRVQSRPQLEMIYTALRECSEVMMTL